MFSRLGLGCFEAGLFSLFCYEDGVFRGCVVSRLFVCSRLVLLEVVVLRGCLFRGCASLRCTRRVQVEIRKFIKLKYIFI